MAEEKIKSKTEVFKENLQKKVLESTGLKVSKQAAWNLFKEFIKTPYEQIITAYNEAGKPIITYGEKRDELSISLSGIGAFRVIPVGGADHLSVKPRFYVSSAIENAVKIALGFKADTPADPDTGATEPATEAAPAAKTDDLDI